MLPLSIPARAALCRAAQPRDGLFMSLEQHHMRHVPRCAPWGPAPRAGTATAPTPDRTTAAQQIFIKKYVLKTLHMYLVHYIGQNIFMLLAFLDTFLDFRLKIKGKQKQPFKAQKKRAVRHTHAQNKANLKAALIITSVILQV